MGIIIIALNTGREVTGAKIHWFNAKNAYGRNDVSFFQIIRSSVTLEFLFGKNKKDESSFGY